ncbi:sialic acid-binding Ig-like lectin 5 [Syngnathoides biaculeatus]|uniref:sialic acid-binding Ig-like lectin 5 n=1 Tax=Syngnathoides biaculeatus TaxID=300417 RepID=UPI002ADD8CED|nr:sialic acid-binding Ig-like lectin 5 [Syngnathoides biaculeatus]
MVIAKSMERGKGPPAMFSAQNSKDNICHSVESRTPALVSFPGHPKQGSWLSSTGHRLECQAPGSLWGREEGHNGEEGSKQEQMTAAGETPRRHERECGQRSHTHVDAAVALMWPLLFAALCTGVQASSLDPSMPDRVLAVVGSCVVIPCSFTPSERKPPEVVVRMRLRDHNRFALFRQYRVAFNSEDMAEVPGEFRGRTSLSGLVTNGDCSLKMDAVSVEDARSYEVALKRIGDFAWGRAKSFSLDVVDTPEAPVISGVSSATDGQVVTFNCSVSYQCPSGPPTMRWQWERGVQPVGDQEVRSLYTQDRQPVLQTSLTFRVSRRVKANLRCEVSYPRANVVAAFKDLHVTFPPKDVTVQVQTLMVQEGGSALLVCSCKADPPVSEYRWSYSHRGRTVHLGQRTHTIRLHNVTRDTAVRCVAENLVGRAQSRTTVLNVHYKPVIQHMSSACILEDRELRCVCSAQSNPLPTLSWNVNGIAPSRGFNASLSANALTATLTGHVDGGVQTVACLALNILGNYSMVLWQRQGGRDSRLLLWCLVPAAAAILSGISLAALVFFCCCRKTSGKHVLRGRPLGQGPYQARMPVYINCSEVSHVYTNGSYQLLYQNCTPRFVRTKQVRPMGRRGGERRRGGARGGVDTQVGTREVQGGTTADPESAIYLEVL